MATSKELPPTKQSTIQAYGEVTVNPYTRQPPGSENRWKARKGIVEAIPLTRRLSHRIQEDVADLLRLVWGMVRWGLLCLMMITILRLGLIVMIPGHMDHVYSEMRGMV